MTAARRWGDYFDRRWDVIETERTHPFEAAVCMVCQKACPQVNACMSCREFAHIDCLEQGVCKDGCKNSHTLA
jgi:hypothetical protein